MSSDLTFAFTRESPKYIELGGHYTGPKNPKMAEYNSGRGWEPCPIEGDIYTHNILPIYSNQISFRGDWRDKDGTYQNLFEYTFSERRGIKDVIMSGTLEHDANNTWYGYMCLFYKCDSIVYMRDNPLPKLKGTLSPGILRRTFSEMRSLVSLPEGFMDMSEMHGEPEYGSLYYTCNDMTGVSSPHIFKLGPSIKLYPDDMIDNIQHTWSGMKNWTGTVLWGDNILFNEIVPDEEVGVIQGCTNMMGYDKIHENWK